MNKTVRNERLKYLAASFDRASTACFAVGGIAPLTSILAGASAPRDSGLFFVMMGVWIMVGVALNRMGMVLLKDLAE